MPLDLPDAAAALNSLQTLSLPYPPPYTPQVLALCLDRGPLVIPGLDALRFSTVMLVPIIPASGGVGHGCTAAIIRMLAAG